MVKHPRNPTSRRVTPPQNVPRELYSSSMESTLLDKSDHVIHSEQPDGERLGRNAQRCEQSGKAKEAILSRNILPLNQVRDLKSFDEIQARSSFLSEGTPPIFTQRSTKSSRNFKEDSGEAQTTQDESGSVIGGETVFSTETLPPASAKTDEMSLPKTPLTANNVRGNPSNGEPYQASSSRIKTPKAAAGRYSKASMALGVCKKRLWSQSSPQATPHSSSPREIQDRQKFNNMFRSNLMARPRFTLENQVDLENIALRKASAQFSQIEASSLVPTTSSHQNLDYIRCGKQQNATSPSVKQSISRPEPIDGGEKLHSALAKPTNENVVTPAPFWTSTTNTGERPFLGAKDLKYHHPGSENDAKAYVLSQRTKLLPEIGAKFLKAKTTLVNGNGNHAPLRSSNVTLGECRVADENEKWMKLVFPDFDRVQKGFRFAPFSIGKEQTHSNQQRKNRFDQSSPLQAQPTTTADSTNPKKNISTSANATILSPEFLHYFHSPDGPVHSETEFMTPISPMEGIIDERLEDVSAYNNAVRTVRSLIPLSVPGQSQLSQLEDEVMTGVDENYSFSKKRSAEIAFGSNLLCGQPWDLLR